jgi:YycE-like protein
VFLDIQNTGAQLELTSGGRHPSPEPHESLLVLYFDTEAELLAAAQRIRAPEVTPANPYWQRNAKCHADPDGFQVLPMLAGRSAS